VFSFSHCAKFGPTTYVFDDVERGADASRSGGCAFSEGVRCPLETWGWGGSDGGVRVE
jgi:hypothetical protein